MQQERVNEAQRSPLNSAVPGTAAQFQS